MAGFKTGGFVTKGSPEHQRMLETAHFPPLRGIDDGQMSLDDMRAGIQYALKAEADRRLQNKLMAIVALIGSAAMLAIALL
ncbi:hypothetical protein D3879_14675 [Pseudomonas cavernicola]|uniref:Uncharacterized protein n=1 Tax=Pseudomonas cavernicola TaxID=2320866 RepID=A0A418XEF7_9PSED|nr:hypothetical protein [Pseudomonas cavernicola]RJG10921.1 hypothetical protein D3879_14675 [Pseudomonas cavernicola]